MPQHSNKQKRCGVFITICPMYKLLTFLIAFLDHIHGIIAREKYSDKDGVFKGSPKVGESFATTKFREVLEESGNIFIIPPSFDNPLFKRVAFQPEYNWILILPYNEARPYLPPLPIKDNGKRVPAPRKCIIIFHTLNNHQRLEHIFRNVDDMDEFVMRPQVDEISHISKVPLRNLEKQILRDRNIPNTDNRSFNAPSSNIILKTINHYHALFANAPMAPQKPLPPNSKARMENLIMNSIIMNTSLKTQEGELSNYITHCAQFFTEHFCKQQKVLFTQCNHPRTCEKIS